MNVQLSERAQREMQRIDASWRSRAEHPELFLDELLEAVEGIEVTSVLGTAYRAKSKQPVTRKLIGVQRRLLVKQARPYNFGDLNAPTDCREF